MYHRRLKSNSSSNIFFVTNKRIALISKDIFGFYKVPIRLLSNIELHVKKKNLLQNTYILAEMDE